MKLKPLSISDMEPIRNWRNEQLSMLRTSFPLTREMQEDFYHNVVSNRSANARYWGIHDNEKLIGMAGIENIQHENRLGEISLLLIPNTMDKYGEEALSLILHEGFMNLNLENIFTEAYVSSPYSAFWTEQEKKRKAGISLLPNRKYYSGKYLGSWYINFNKGDFLNNENIIS